METDDPECVTIPLQGIVKDFVQRKVKEGGFAAPTDFVAHLLEDEAKKDARARLDQMLLDGINSGQPIELTPDYWEEKRKRLAEKYAERAVK